MDDGRQLLEWYRLDMKHVHMNLHPRLRAVTEIPGDAFEHAEFRSLVIGDKVKRLGHGAFEEMEQLEYLHLANVEEIDRYAFDRNYQLNIHSSQIVDINPLKYNYAGHSSE